MMFSYRLVRLIESHADALAAGLEEKVQSSLQVTHFRDISAHELRERVYEIYRHLGEWLLGKNELDIEHRYREIGRAVLIRKCRSARSSRPLCSPRKISGSSSRAKPWWIARSKSWANWNSCRCSRCFLTGRFISPLWGTRKKLRARRTKKAHCGLVRGADNDVDVLGNGLQEAAEDARRSAALREVGDAGLYPAGLCRAGDVGGSADEACAGTPRCGNRAHDDHGLRPLRGPRNGGPLPPQRDVHRLQCARGGKRWARGLYPDLPERD